MAVRTSDFAVALWFVMFLSTFLTSECCGLIFLFVSFFSNRKPNTFTDLNVI